VIGGEHRDGIVRLVVCLAIIGMNMCVMEDAPSLSLCEAARCRRVIVMYVP
jgi:hypothetical protein